MKIKSNGTLPMDNNDSKNLNVQLNKVYDKLSNHLVKKIRLASNNGKDKGALEVIKNILFGSKNFIIFKLYIINKLSFYFF